MDTPNTITSGVHVVHGLDSVHHASMSGDIGLEQAHEL